MSDNIHLKFKTGEDHDYKTCEDEECQECCTHDEFDHYICLYCGKEFEPADFFDEDYGQER